MKQKPRWKPRRCPTSGKVAHRSENSAAVHLLSLQHSRAWDGESRHVYECPDHPGEWLVGRPKKRRSPSSAPGTSTGSTYGHAA